MEKRSKSFDIQLNSISQADDPNKKEVTFILHDFELSHNNAFISKETAQKSLHSLKNTPIVAKYFEESEPGANDDALGGHEASIGTQRSSGNQYIQLNTTPIGTFTEEAYIDTVVDSEGNEKEVVFGKGVLWSSRFPNVIGLLNEWIDEGIEVTSSMEILYDEFLYKDGKEEILNFVYDGNCVLNSSDRGEHSKVYPAYDVSKLTRLVAQAINQNKEKETDKVDKFKKIFELSHSDIRTAIYKAFDPTLDSNQYSYIRDVYDNKVIIEIDTVTEESYESKQYQYNYTKSSDDTVSIDLDSQTEVMKKTEWVQLNEVKELQKQLNEKDIEIKSLNESSEGLKKDKTDLETKFNKATETITQLNESVKELKPFKEQAEADKLEKQLNEKQEFYSAKFETLGAKEKYESDEVQDLVKKSVNDSAAVMQLNSMLVDLVTKDNNQNGFIRQENQRREDLIPDSDDFESKYSL
ncbi:hypothetical protein GCM10008931_42880 [Oceanobacillus oncorhynchi subsp. oncorhynchi]|uniref:hypothetical protein n=1 Tax=Oceanobacillus oncorhynchi TaxID=545501 RepID=UPI0031DADA14